MVTFVASYQHLAAGLRKKKRGDGDGEGSGGVDACPWGHFLRGVDLILHQQACQLGMRNDLHITVISALTGGLNCAVLGWCWAVLGKDDLGRRWWCQGLGYPYGTNNTLDIRLMMHS